VTIGDQNSTGNQSWVNKLREKIPDDKVLNFSVPGNTYGFNNQDNEKLNTVNNIDNYLDSALDSVGGHKIDYLFIALGTNDCQSTYDGQLPMVPDHLRELIRKINAFPGFKSRPPHIIVLSPVPFGPDSILPARYKGADERVKYLLPYFRDITHNSRCDFIDIYSRLKPDFNRFSPNGIHLNEKGQAFVADTVFNYIEVGEKR